MDITNAILDPELGCSAFTVERLTYTRTADGTTSRSATHQAMGCIHPGTPEMIQLLPEEERHEEFIAIYTDFPLSLGSDRGSTYTGPDRIHWNSETWRVVRVRDWAMFGYYQALAVLLREEPNSELEVIPMAYNVYSLPDCKSVLYHPDVGTCNLHQCGMGKIVVSAAGDLTSHTTTADGYIVVNKLKTTNGTVTLEVPQNSVGDDFLRRWARWARSTASPNRIALGTLTIYDAVAGFTVVCTGIRLQKVPDRTFDRTGTNLTYTLLATTITEQ